MYDIYLKNFYRDGRLVKDEIRLYSVPIQEGDFDNVLTDPSVSGETGKTGTLEFTVYPNHPYYHAFAQMRTIMRVDYDGDTIFRGRILTVDNTMTGVKKIHCEGDMAFLLDSFQMGSKEEERPEISLNAYIHQILDEHNRQMSEAGETDKCIYAGMIPGEYPDEMDDEQIIEDDTDTFGSNGHEQSMNALEAVAKTYGGFFRTRYDIEDGKTYLDWCRNWFYKDLDNSQPIAITQNIIDANSNSEVDNIFTAMIPVGKSESNDVFITGYKKDIHGNNNRILVPQITKVFSEAELDRGYVNKSIYEKAVEQYGIIYKVQNFSNAETPAQLWEYACDWIRNNYVGGITSYDLTAVDMHHVNGQIEKYLVGDCVPLELPSDMTELDEYNPDKKSSVIYRTILSAKYNLHNPDKNSYTAGIPSDILSYEYGASSTSKSKSGGGGGKGGAAAKGGKTKTGMDKIGGDSEMTEQLLDSIAWSYLVTPRYNNDLYKELVKQDEKDGTERAKSAMKSSHVNLMRDIRMLEVQEDGSKEEKYMGLATTMVLDASLGVLNFFTPAVEYLGVDEWGNKLTDLRTTKSLEIDGYNGYLNVKQLPSYHDTPIANGIEAIGKGLDVIGEKASYLIDPLNVFGLRNKEKGAEMTFKTGIDAIDNAVTAYLDGETGLSTELLNAVFPEGFTEEDLKNPQKLLEKATIFQNGGGNNGSGSQEVGKKNNKWLIKMNEPLQYRDENNVIHTVPNGTIDAADYAILDKLSDPIPSVFAQVGVFKTLIAENARLIDLKADNAEFGTVKAEVANLKTVTSNLVNANYVKASDLSANTISLCNHQVRPVPFSQLGISSYVLAVVG